MSSDFLNVKEQIMHPSGEHICFECGKPIQRNVAITTDGNKHHFGCLKKGQSHPAWHCRDCGAELTRSQVGKIFIQGTMTRGCGLCGSTNVEPIRDYAKSWRVIHPGEVTT